MASLKIFTTMASHLPQADRQDTEQQHQGRTGTRLRRFEKTDTSAKGPKTQRGCEGQAPRGGPQAGCLRRRRSRGCRAAATTRAARPGHHTPASEVSTLRPVALGISPTRVTR